MYANAVLEVKAKGVRCVGSPTLKTGPFASTVYNEPKEGAAKMYNVIGANVEESVLLYDSTGTAVKVAVTSTTIHSVEGYGRGTL